jgi:uncharacterized membrane protein
MSYKTYRMWQAILGGIMGGVTGGFISINWIIPVITIIISIVIMMILRRSVKEIVADERTHAIADKAARFTFQVATIGMAVVGAIIIVVSYANTDSSPALKQLGLALEYAVCALLLINLLAYTYYNHKLGGRV